MAYRVEIPPSIEENSEKLSLPKNTGDTGDKADITEGRITAVLIASEVLGCDIWFTFDDSFKVDDGLAVFYADELPFLVTKDAETLKEIHKVKLAFPGCRVIQEGAESSRR